MVVSFISPDVLISLGVISNKIFPLSPKASSSRDGKLKIDLLKYERQNIRTKQSMLESNEINLHATMPAEPYNYVTDH